MAVESNGTFLIDSAMKAQQWETAKGALRALIGIQGAYSYGDAERFERPRQKLEALVDTFIQNVEDNGLHE